MIGRINDVTVIDVQCVSASLRASVYLPQVVQAVNCLVSIVVLAKLRIGFGIVEDESKFLIKFLVEGLFNK